MWRSWVQLDDQKENGSFLPFKCLQTLQLFSWESVGVAPPAFTHWLNTPAPLNCRFNWWCLPVSELTVKGWAGGNVKECSLCNRTLKLLVCAVSSGVLFVNCLRCLTDEFFLPTSHPLAVLCHVHEQKNVRLSECLISFHWWWISVLISKLELLQWWKATSFCNVWLTPII